MRQILLGKHQYKANLHMHTTVSDGNLTPEETKRIYLAHGYSIVAFTDHDRIVPHTELRDASFLPITACEIELSEAEQAGVRGRRRTYHLNLYAKDEEYEGAFPVSAEMDYSSDSANALIADANEKGFLVSYNHPVWSLQSYEDYGRLQGLWGIEVYNSSASQMGYLDTVHPFEEILRRGTRLFPLASDDAHRSAHCFGGWVMVASPSLEYREVMNALERGDLYASCGPQIHEMTLEDGILSVQTSPVVAAYLTTERRYTKTRLAREGRFLTELRFDLNAFFEESLPTEAPSYFRLTLRDANGNQAFSRAYFTDELI